MSALILEEPTYFEEREMTLPRIYFFFFLNFSEYIIQTKKKKQPYLHNLLISLISYQLLLATFMAANITHSHWVTLKPILHLISVLAASQTQEYEGQKPIPCTH